MASHWELVQYQKSLSAHSEPLRFPLGPLGIPDMKFLDIPKDFSIDHLIGVSVFQFFDTIEKTNLSNPRKGKTIKDIQKLTGAEILFLKGNQGRKPKKLEIRGSVNAVKLAEEFLWTFFKHKNPSQAKPSLKIRTASAIFWIYLDIFRDYGLKNIFLEIKLFCFSRC